MKLLSLNTEFAVQGNIFYNYIKEQARTTDIFCFQEVFAGGEGAPEIYQGAHIFGFTELQDLLPGYSGVFEPKSTGYADLEPRPVAWPVSLGLAVFFNKNSRLISCKSETVGDATAGGGYQLEGLVKIQILELAGSDSKSFYVINIHGMSRPGTKADTPERLAQSQNIVKTIRSLPKASVILCGDFNLMPETESVRIIESELENLITAYRITNTRNEISWSRYGNGLQHFADYTFVSKQVKVKNFQVPYNLVSDHLPMILEFEL